MFLFQTIFGLSYYVWTGIFLLLLLLLYAYFQTKKLLALAEQMRISNGYYDYLYPNDLLILWEDKIENAENSEQVEILVDNAWTAFKNRNPLPKEAFEASKKKVLMWEKHFRDFGYRDLSSERLDFIAILLFNERLHLEYDKAVFYKFFGQPEQRKSFPNLDRNYKSISETFDKVTMLNATELNFIEERLSKKKWQEIMTNVIETDFNGQKIAVRTAIINKAIGKEVS